MQNVTFWLLSSFTRPETVGTTPLAMLWLLPLVGSVSVIYKAAKLRNITTVNFIKETATLFGSIIVFIGITALVLYVVALLAT